MCRQSSSAWSLNPDLPCAVHAAGQSVTSTGTRPLSHLTPTTVQRIDLKHRPGAGVTQKQVPRLLRCLHIFLKR